MAPGTGFAIRRSNPSAANRPSSRATSTSSPLNARTRSIVSVIMTVPSQSELVSLDRQLLGVRRGRHLEGVQQAGHEAVTARVLPVAHHADGLLARPGLAGQRHVRGPDERAVLLARGGDDGQLALFG